MSLVVIDSGGANLGSVLYALQRLGADARVSRDADEIRRAQRVILPGVGAAGDAMARLRESGLDQVIPRLTQPLLGICLGLQLLFEHSAEDDVACLGVFPGQVRRFAPQPGLRVPHMGWNRLDDGGNANTRAALPPAVGDQPWAYFVHSYYAPLGDYTWARCTHGVPFTAIARRANFLAAQFHPERSATAGAALLRYFLAQPGGMPSP